MSSSKLKMSFGIGGRSGFLVGFGGLCLLHLKWSVLGSGISLYPSRNCSGGGNMMSSSVVIFAVTATWI